MPVGRPLPQAEWDTRHRLLTRILWFSGPALVVFGIIRQFGVLHVVSEAAPVAVAAFLAQRTGLSRRNRSLVTAVGLMTASAVYAHLSGGGTEAHFVFFVTLPLLTLYQEWLPFHVGGAFLMFHHGVLGRFMPSAVYGSANAHQAWAWAATHAVFGLGASGVALFAWNRHEEFREQLDAAYRRLQRSERQLTDAQRVANVGSWQLELTTNKAEWSEQLYRMLGVSPAEVDGSAETYLRLVHSDDRQRVRRAMEEALADGRPFECEHRLVRADGEHRILSCHGQIDVDDQGQPLRAVMTAHDVTERVLAERERQWLTERLTRLLECSGEGIYGTDASGRCIFVNRQAAALLGYSPDELLGRDNHERIHHGGAAGSTCPGAPCAVQRALRAGEASRVDDQLLWRRDGTAFAAQFSASPVLEDGALDGVVVTFSDITQRRQGEQQLREAMERQHVMVEELQALNRVKDEFVSTVSHELRTPLTSIRGYVEMLVDGTGGPVSDDQLKMLNVLDRNASRLLTQIEDLLTLSRLESGEWTMELAPTELGPLVLSGAQAVLPTATRRSLQLVVDVADDLTTVMGDGAQLDRVLLNLLSNAIKFTLPGGSVIVDARRIDDRAVVTVADTGMGIPSDEQPKLGTRFFRSSLSRREAIPGTGLGLFIAKSIVERHGGTLELASAPGIGTTVTITLPLVDDPAPVAALSS